MGGRGVSEGEGRREERMRQGDKTENRGKGEEISEG